MSRVIVLDTSPLGLLATEVLAFLEQPAEGTEGAPELVWIEHYPRRGLHEKWPEEFAQVSFTWTGRSFVHPRWRFMTRAEVEALIGGPLEEGRPE